MKKLLRRIFLVMLCLVLAFVLVRFAPNIYERLFGNANIQWISERFSETLREKNELVVYEVETTGQETVSQDAWLIGTVQKVEMPYTFNMNFTVDLSLVKVTVVGNTIEVHVPRPVAGYQKITVDETKMHKTDWLYPLTPERYASIKKQVEERLFQEASSSTEYEKNAWGVTVKNLETLFKTVAESSAGGVACEIRVVQDNTLVVAPSGSTMPQTSPTGI